MKTAVSVPDDLFDAAERLARRTRRSRSDVYRRALEEYLARHEPDRVTEAMDQTLAEIGDETDPFVSSVGRRTIGRSEW